MAVVGAAGPSSKRPVPGRSPDRTPPPQGRFTPRTGEERRNTPLILSCANARGNRRVPALGRRSRTVWPGLSHRGSTVDKAGRLWRKGAHAPAGGARSPGGRGRPASAARASPSIEQVFAAQRRYSRPGRPWIRPRGPQARPGGPCTKVIRPSPDPAANTTPEKTPSAARIRRSRGGSGSGPSGPVTGAAPGAARRRRSSNGPLHNAQPLRTWDTTPDPLVLRRCDGALRAAQAAEGERTRSRRPRPRKWCHPPVAAVGAVAPCATGPPLQRRPARPSGPDGAIVTPSRPALRSPTPDRRHRRRWRRSKGRGHR